MIAYRWAEAKPQRVQVNFFLAQIHMHMCVYNACAQNKIKMKGKIGLKLSYVHKVFKGK